MGSEWFVQLKYIFIFNSTPFKGAPIPINSMLFSFLYIFLLSDRYDIWQKSGDSFWKINTRCQIKKWNSAFHSILKGRGNVQFTIQLNIFNFLFEFKQFSLQLNFQYKLICKIKKNVHFINIHNWCNKLMKHYLCHFHFLNDS